MLIDACKRASIPKSSLFLSPFVYVISGVGPLISMVKSCCAGTSRGKVNPPIRHYRLIEPAFPDTFRVAAVRFPLQLWTEECRSANQLSAMIWSKGAVGVQPSLASDVCWSHPLYPRLLRFSKHSRITHGPEYFGASFVETPCRSAGVSFTVTIVPFGITAPGSSRKRSRLVVSCT